MALLLVVLVALASLTRIETQVAANSQQLSQARQNALLALTIAVGELQKYTGPDQRVIARADIDSALADTPSANGRWIAAYGARVAPDYADTPFAIADKLAATYAAYPSDPLVSKGSQAILLNWLVSGNEATDFNPLSHVAADGHVTLVASPDIAHEPSSPVDLASTRILPEANDSSALLLGPASATAIHDHVAAPLVPLTTPANTLPGFGQAGTDPVKIGRYAWWIGDENTKARIDLAILPASPAGQSGMTAPHAFVVAQRSAVELIDGVTPSGTPSAFNASDLLGPAYDPTSSSLRNLLELDQLALLSPAHSATLDAARRLRGHDLTTTSASLLTDTYAGGLRKDLSAMLAIGATSPADSDPLFPPHSADPRDRFGVPTWGKLRSFVRQTSDGTALAPRLPSDTDVGLYPVLTFAEIALEYFKPLPDSIRLAVFPRAVLWNPYSTALAPARYEFGVNIAATAGLFQLQGKLPAAAAFSKKETTRYLGRAADTLPDSVANGYLRFEINVTEPIPPGESHIFVLSGVSDYDAPLNGPPGNTLTRGVLPRHALLPDTGLTAVPGEIFRVAGDGDQHLDPVLTNRRFRNNASAFLGEISTTSPDGPEWPAAGKPWYQVIGRATVSGAPAYPWLQGGAGGADLQSTPGTQTWGVQIRHMMANRIRHIANTNPRAPFRASTSYQNSRATISTQGTDLVANDFDPSTDNRASAAFSLDVVANQPADSILFEFRPADRPLLSLGQLQHANLSFIVDQPAYPLGNSLAPYIHLNPDKTRRDRLQRVENIPTVPPSNLLSGHHDLSYLLNRALWDGYFVSTVPHAATPVPDTLANPRLARQSTATDSDLRDARKAAAHLVIRGGFNINSTSEQAWRAILGGLNQLAHEASGTPDDPLAAALPRFSRPPAALPLARADWAFTGYRRLTAEQIAALAANIVAEVRARGPFVSLGDFVNRRLKDNPDTAPPASGTPYNADETLKGALQNAIDNTPVSGPASVNNARGVAPFSASTVIDVSTATTELDADAMRGGPPRAGSIPQHPYGSLSAAAPQFLTQADILSALGPSLSARSDTFTVRAYGDTTNPVTGEITGRAWCEAVVQRTVEPLRRRNADPASPDYHEPATATPAAPDLGRRYRITSFRWLTPNDI